MSSQTRWIPRGTFQPLRYRPGGVGNWSGHLPFASDLVAAVRPQLLVELGTHYGESYFGFCQAVAEHNVFSPCYAVDTWVGEEQTGSYDESVYQEVSAYNEANYKSFSYLLRTTFDQAVENFLDDSIGILHIDGLHTCDAVSHDFHKWLPKVAPGGVVLLHDVVARHSDFGVWKLWEEIAGLGDRFLFTHSWGLGVFRKPGKTPIAPDLLSLMLYADPEEQKHFQRFYALCALKLEYEHSQTNHAIPQDRRPVDLQIFPKIAEGYSLGVCYSSSVQSGQWQQAHFELSAGIGEGPLRLDLAQQPCLIDVASITLRSAVRGEVLWTLAGTEIAALEVGGDMSVVESPEMKEFCRYLSTGNDPQLYLPSLSGQNFDQPLYLDIWMRVYAEVASLLQTVKSQHLDRAGQNETASREKAPREEVAAEPVVADAHPVVDTNAAALSESNAALEELRVAYGQLIQQHETLTHENTLLAQSYRKAQSDLYVTKTDLDHAKANLGRAQTELQAKIEETLAVRDGLVHARNLEAAKRNEVERTMEEMIQSRSWRLTAPLRNFKTLFR